MAVSKKKHSVKQKAARKKKASKKKAGCKKKVVKQTFSRIKNNAAFLRYLHTSGLQKRRRLFKDATAAQLKCLCECAFNILRQNIPVSPLQLIELRKPKNKKLLYKLADKKIPLAKKRKALVDASTSKADKKKKTKNKRKKVKQTLAERRKALVDAAAADL